MKERELLTLKERIDTAKSKVSELRGRQSYLLQELDKQWGCKNIRQGEAKLSELGNELAKLDKQINEGVAKLTEEMNQ